MNKHSFIIATGISGAGKSTALAFLEDMGYFCVDNLPTILIEKFAEICFNPETGIYKVAVGIDIRGATLFDDLLFHLDELLKKDYDFKILFLDCQNEVLVKRFKETRRIHPLSKNNNILEGIEEEKKILEKIKQKSDYVIDTSQLLTRQLKCKLIDIFVDKKNFKSIVITIESFGFKYGVPLEADLVFDVRFLPNPFYLPELRDLTGNDQVVQEFVMKSDISKTFLEKLIDMTSFLIPNYIAEGKNSLVIAIGCTGGKHRSVTLANKLYEFLSKEQNYSTYVKHINIKRGLN